MPSSIKHSSTATHEVERAGQETDLAQLYESIAAEWARNKPEARDDLIGWPLIIQKTKTLALGGSVLDVGCGTGNICRLIAPLAKTVIGLDISRNMIGEAEQISAPTNVHYLRADMLKMSQVIAPSSIDLALSVYGFCCLRNEQELHTAFVEAHRVIRPKGFMLAHLPHPAEPFLRPRSGWARDIDVPGNYFEEGSTVRRRLRLGTGREVLVGRHHFSLAAYLSAALDSGFSIEEFLEPRPTPELLSRFPDLRFENEYPSSIMLVLQRRS